MIPTYCSGWPTDRDTPFKKSPEALPSERRSIPILHPSTSAQLFACTIQSVARRNWSGPSVCFISSMLLTQVLAASFAPPQSDAIWRQTRSPGRIAMIPRKPPTLTRPITTTAMIAFFVCRDSHDGLVFARRLHGSHNLATEVGQHRETRPPRAQTVNPGFCWQAEDIPSELGVAGLAAGGMPGPCFRG